MKGNIPAEIRGWGVGGGVRQPNWIWMRRELHSFDICYFSRFFPLSTVFGLGVTEVQDAVIDVYSWNMLFTTEALTYLYLFIKMMYRVTLWQYQTGVSMGGGGEVYDIDPLYSKVLDKGHILTTLTGCTSIYYNVRANPSPNHQVSSSPMSFCPTYLIFYFTFYFHLDIIYLFEVVQLRPTRLQSSVKWQGYCHLTLIARLSLIIIVVWYYYSYWLNQW